LDSTAKSDALGLLALRPGRPPGGASQLALGRRGDDVALVTLPSGREFVDGDDTVALLYTDRAIYRPQQKLFWKVLLYRERRLSGPVAAAAGESVTVWLADPNGQKVAEQTVATNAYGTAAGELAIPAGRPLGRWTLWTSARGQRTVEVEEYKRPTFEVKLREPETALRLNRPATLAGEARYYFGLPVAHGTVKWRVTREPVYPFWWGWWRGGRATTQGQTVAAGTVQLPADGTYKVTFTPAADERQGAAVTYRFRLHAEVTDDGGETRDAERVVNLGTVAIEAQLSPSARFLHAGETGAVAIVRRDLDGTPRAGVGRWKLYELRQPERPLLPAEEPETSGAGPEDGKAPVEARFRTPGDLLRPRWATLEPVERQLHGWTDGRLVASGEVRHDARGKAEVALAAQPAGVYRLRYETNDDFGAPFKASTEVLVVADRATPLALPLVLLARDATVHVGGKAQLLVHSGFPGQTLFVEVLRGTEVVSARRLAAGSDPSLVELPVGPDDRGGFVVRATAVRDHQLLTATTNVDVPWSDRELQVAFSTFRDTL
ncbi:MAG TPA: MG2 domain-containing protein, partial [Thermoanaerobaculia bacterium]